MGSDGGSIPAAWFHGDFQLDASTEASPVPADAASMPKAGGADVASHVSYQHALHAYEALCTVANSVNYDVPYEEGLRSVESRDAGTGLAMSWITRRASAPPVGVHTVQLHSSNAPSAGVQASRVGSAVRAQPAPPLSLYTPPPSSHGVLRSSSSSSSSFSSPPSRRSLSSTLTPTSRSAQQQRSQVGRRPSQLASSPATVSTVGTAVMSSSTAHYVTALRHAVQAQRRHSACGKRGNGRLDRFASSSRFPGGADAADEEEEAEWRTCVEAAVTLAVCPACAAMFEHVLNTLSALGEGGDAATTTRDHTRNENNGGDAIGLRTTVCPRCAHIVPVRVATAPSQRWMLPPAVDHAGAERPPTVSATSPLPPPSLPPPPPTVSPASVVVAASAGTCGTDSVGFACDDGEETFAALIARIRASKKEAADHTSPPPRTSTSTAASTSTSTDADGDAARHAPRHVSVGVDMSESALAVPPPSQHAVDPMVSRLRAALSHLYFFELTTGNSAAALEHGM